MLRHGHRCVPARVQAPGDAVQDPAHQREEGEDDQHADPAADQRRQVQHPAAEGLRFGWGLGGRFGECQPQPAHDRRQYAEDDPRRRQKDESHDREHGQPDHPQCPQHPAYGVRRQDLAEAQAEQDDRAAEAHDDDEPARIDAQAHAPVPALCVEDPGQAEQGPRQQARKDKQHDRRTQRAGLRHEGQCAARQHHQHGNDRFSARDDLGLIDAQEHRKDREQEPYPQRDEQGKQPGHIADPVEHRRAVAHVGKQDHGRQRQRADHKGPHGLLVMVCIGQAHTTPPR